MTFEPTPRINDVCESYVCVPLGAKLLQEDHGPFRLVAVLYLLSFVAVASCQRYKWVYKALAESSLTPPYIIKVSQSLVIILTAVSRRTYLSTATQT